MLHLRFLFIPCQSPCPNLCLKLLCQGEPLCLPPPRGCRLEEKRMPWRDYPPPNLDLFVVLGFKAGKVGFCSQGSGAERKRAVGPAQSLRQKSLGQAQGHGETGGGPWGFAFHRTPGLAGRQTWPHLSHAGCLVGKHQEWVPVPLGVPQGRKICLLGDEDSPGGP